MDAGIGQVLAALDRAGPPTTLSSFSPPTTVGNAGQPFVGKGDLTRRIVSIIVAADDIGTGERNRHTMVWTAPARRRRFRTAPRLAARRCGPAAVAGRRAGRPRPVLAHLNQGAAARPVQIPA